MQRQVHYTLIPTQRNESGHVLFKRRDYVADFVYHQNGKLVVEDFKGYRTEVYKMKKALMYERYGILVREVTNGRSVSKLQRTKRKMPR